MDLLFATSLVLALAAAARSTWSPCGLSMLSSINPVGEAGRGHRYPRSAAWYIAGSTAGGLTLGAAMAGLAGLVHLAQVPAHGLLVAGAAAAAIGAAVDLGLLGVRLPLIRRQVDERWLDRYRPTVYAVGFGWQIGVGLATYLMTAGVLVAAVLAIATGSPVRALAVGGVFGLARGLTILAGAGMSTPASLRTVLRRLDRLAAPVRTATIVVQLSVGVALVAVIGWPEALAAGAVALAAVSWPALRPAAPRSPAA